MLHSLFTHSCVAARHSSNFILEFANGTTIAGLISDNDAYRDGVQSLVDQCHYNNFSLKVSKTKELFIDLHRQAVTMRGDVLARVKGSDF